jgi:hypothetical protein
LTPDRKPTDASNIKSAQKLRVNLTGIHFDSKLFYIAAQLCYLIDKQKKLTTWKTARTPAPYINSINA